MPISALPPPAAGAWGTGTREELYFGPDAKHRAGPPLPGKGVKAGQGGCAGCSPPNTYFYIIIRMVNFITDIHNLRKYY